MFFFSLCIYLSLLGGVLSHLIVLLSIIIYRLLIKGKGRGEQQGKTGTCMSRSDKQIKGVIKYILGGKKQRLEFCFLLIINLFQEKLRVFSYHI